MLKNNIYFDCHVHIGQYKNIYYYPKMVVKALKKNNIKEFWVSSTTSCIEWANDYEKSNIINVINSEIAEVVSESLKYNIKVIPLYWVLPKRFFEGESIEDIMDGSLYKGFKIHTFSKCWDENDDRIKQLINDVFSYANKNKLPVLIHTGEDYDVRPERFEKYFSLYPNVIFVLAHCKNADPIIKIFSKNKNVYGDIAFCNKNSFRTICKFGYKERMLSGSDFPITDWIRVGYKRKNVNEIRLKLDYWYNKKQIRNLL